jgi:hypothetical protein
MDGGDREENLRFGMDFIKEPHGSEHYSMAGITIRNESIRPENLDRQLLLCYKQVVCPGEKPGAPSKGE